MQEGLAERPVFGVGGRTVRWDDVLAWAERVGALGELRRETALGLAALERDGPPPAADVRAAGSAFRYARGLLAADELEAWLARWQLATEDWLAHLRRTIARDRATGSEAHSPPPAPRELVLADAICSGALERWAWELAARLAIAPDADGDEVEARFDAFRRAAVTDLAVAREIDGRRLEWLRAEGELVSLADEDLAREVALCAREDGDPLDELAVRAGVPLEPLGAYLDDLPPELAAALLGAGAGELLGPLAVDGRWVVARVRRKAAASADDPVLRERAARLLVARAVEREVESSVTWHERP